MSGWSVKLEVGALRCKAGSAMIYWGDMSHLVNNSTDSDRYIVPIVSAGLSWYGIRI
jgi:hypothetical protein